MYVYEENAELRIKFIIMLRNIVENLDDLRNFDRLYYVNNIFGSVLDQFRKNQ